MKLGLNKSDIAKVAKMMRKRTPLSLIAKRLHTTVAVVKKFTPDKVAAAKKNAKMIEVHELQKSTKRKETVEAAVAGAVAAVEATPKPVDDLGI